MTGPPLRILAVGAHPDDCEYKAGGVAALWSAAGHVVRFVSATNGDAGHQTQGGAQLARRRIAEAADAARILGAESIVLPISDGQLEPTLANRKLFIRAIRRFAPDLILTHRPNDYHPDHRYTSLLVQDSAFMVTVPNVVPETPPLRHNPSIAYFSDSFRKPCPFQPTVAVAIDPVFEKKTEALHAHASQFYEWLPWLAGRLEQVPAEPAARKQWLFDRANSYELALADQCRELLIARYGRPKGQAVRYAEAFEASEYGSPLDGGQIERLFGGL